MDPVILSRKLAKTRKQFHRVSHALVGEQFHTLVEDFRRAARANRPRESLTVLWHRVADYLKVCALRSQKPPALYLFWLSPVFSDCT